MLKQFESTVRDVLKENLGNKENKAPDFESMINTVQRSMLNKLLKFFFLIHAWILIYFDFLYINLELSLLSERPVLQENIKSDVDSPCPAAILEAQVKNH